MKEEIICALPAKVPVRGMRITVRAIYNEIDHLRRIIKTQIVI